MTGPVCAVIRPNLRLLMQPYSSLKCGDLPPVLAHFYGETVDDKCSHRPCSIDFGDAKLTPC